MEGDDVLIADLVDSEGDVDIGQIISKELSFLGAYVGPGLATCAMESKEISQIGFPGDQEIDR
eukprot:1368441-Karenia_brevis.AAC.1